MLAEELATNAVQLHLVPSESAALGRILEAAEGNGMSQFRIDMEGIRDRVRLAMHLGEELLFPKPARGLDATLGWMGNLEWFGNRAGYLLVFDGLDDLHREAPNVLDDLVGILPNVCDRHRSGSEPFSAVLLGGPETLSHAAEVIAKENAHLEEVAEQPWDHDTRPAAVRFYDSDDERYGRVRSVLDDC